MANIKRVAFHLPANTSAIRVEPAYVKPLLQIKHNAKQGDRAFHVQQLPEIPAALPKAAHILVGVTWEGEAQRLMAEFGLETFQRIYPADDMFRAAFDACKTDALPGEEQAVPSVDESPEALIDEFLELEIPTFTREMAKKLVDAGLLVPLMPMADVAAVHGRTQIPLNLLKTIVEATKKRDERSAPRGAPSAPSEFRPSSIEKVGSITE